MSEADTSLVEELQSEEYDYVDVDRLKEHPINVEVYGEVDPRESFVEDIERNGIETPLIVNDHEDCTDTVIGGHRRLEGAKRAGLKRVPVRWVSYPEPMATRRVILNNNQRDKTEGQQTREALVLEDTARKMPRAGSGTRNDLQPRRNCDEVSYRWDVDVAEQVGVSKDSVRRGTDVFRIAYPDEYVHDELRNPEKYDVPKSVREVARRQVELMDKGRQSFHGAKKRVDDAIKQEKIKAKSLDAETDIDIRCGDAFDELNRLEDDSIDLFLTDPPYGVLDDEAWDDIDDYTEFFERWFSLAVSKLKEEHTGFVFADARRMYELEPIVSEYTELKNTIIWVRKNMSQGRAVGTRFISAYEPIFYFGTRELNFPEDWGGERFDVQEFAVPQTNTDDKKYHPTQKPLDLIHRLVTVGSYEGDTILDPFAGSLTTGVAAKKAAGRRTILIERNEDYVDIGRGRINEL